MRYRQNTKGDILYGPPVIKKKFESSQRTLFLLFLVPGDKYRSQRAGDLIKNL